MELKLWPWDRDEKPFFVNEKYEWYIEKDMRRKKDLPDIIPFILRDIKTGEADLRVLMDKKTGDVIWEGTSLEAMGCYMDLLYLNKTMPK